jgi:transposase
MALMYLRYTTRRKDGKEHTYWRLVRSVRRNGKVIQETVAQLGELDAQGRARAKAFAREIMGQAEQRELFEERPAENEVVSVDLKNLRLERSRMFGDIWLAWKLWRALQMDELCTKLLPEGREAAPWSLMAFVLVCGRLCSPSSELYIAENWYRRTALEDILGLSAEEVNDDRLYRALDRLSSHKEAIERHLKKRLGELFDLKYDLLLYDVTSTYFEGQANGNPQAQRGYSRDHRPDCKQVCIALVVTRDGMPLGYEVFDGNRTDVTTVEEIVGIVEARYGAAERVWVMDRGMSSEENISWLQGSGRRYIIGTSRSELKKFNREVADSNNWRKVQHGVEAKLCKGPDGAELFLLCRSVERRAKEKAMHERFSVRIEEGLARLASRIDKSRRPLDRSRIDRQIGRLLGRNSRAAGRYEIHLKGDADNPSGLRLRWHARKDWDDWAQLSEGCYLLRTNVVDWSSEELFKTYIQLTEAESAFRIHKSDLSIRPIWHHRKERVQAHILVCFLAYVMWKTLEQWQEHSGLGNSPRTILCELSQIQSVDVVMPVVGRVGRELRIRCVVRPDRSQAMLLDRLGLQLPERLKIAPVFAKM